MGPRFVDSALDQIRRDIIIFVALAIFASAIGVAWAIVWFVITAEGLGWDNESSWITSVFLGLVVTSVIFLVNQSAPFRLPLRGIVILSIMLIMVNEVTWYVAVKELSVLSIVVVLVAGAISLYLLRLSYRDTFGRRFAVSSSQWR